MKRSAPKHGPCPIGRKAVSPEAQLPVLPTKQHQGLNVLTQSRRKVDIVRCPIVFTITGSYSAGTRSFMVSSVPIIRWRCRLGSGLR